MQKERGRTMKRILSLTLAVLLALALTLTGCGGGASGSTASGAASPAQPADGGEEATDPAAGEPVKLRYMTWVAESAQPTYYEFLMKTAEDLNIDLEWHYVDNKQLDNVLNTQMAAGEGPDVFEVGGQFLGQAAAGFHYDLTGQPFIDRFLDSYIDTFTYEGKVCGVPKTAFFAGINYNKAIFEEYGIEVPTTWDEFLAIGEKLEGSGIRPLVIGGKTFGDCSWPIFGTLNMSLYSNPDNMLLDNQFGAGEAKVADYWKEDLEKYWMPMMENGYFTADLVGLETAQAANEFAMGNAAMFPSTTSWIPQIEEMNPELDFEQFPYPTVDGSTGWCVGAAGNCVSINANTKNLDASLRLLDAISTEEGQVAMSADEGGPSGLKDLEIPIPERAKLLEEPLKEGHLYATWIKWPYAGQLIEDLSKGVQLVYSGDMTLDEFLDMMDKRNLEILQG